MKVMKVDPLKTVIMSWRINMTSNIETFNFNVPTSGHTLYLRRWMMALHTVSTGMRAAGTAELRSSFNNPTFDNQIAVNFISGSAPIQENYVIGISTDVPYEGRAKINNLRTGWTIVTNSPIPGGGGTVEAFHVMEFEIE